MTMIYSRRSILRGLFAMPAIVAASSLMPIRGVPLILNPPGARWNGRDFETAGDALGAVFHWYGGILDEVRRKILAGELGADSGLDFLLTRPKQKIEVLKTHMTVMNLIPPYPHSPPHRSILEELRPREVREGNTVTISFPPVEYTPHQVPSDSGQGGV